MTATPRTRIFAAACLTAALAVPVQGREQPAGCNATAAALSLDAYVNGEMSLGPVQPGDVVIIRATLFNPAPAGCNFEGGQLAVTLPDGTLLPMAGYADTPAIPAVTYGAPFIAESDAFVVPPSADPALLVRASYGPTADLPAQSSGFFDIGCDGVPASATSALQLLMGPLSGDTGDPPGCMGAAAAITLVALVDGQPALDAVAPGAKITWRITLSQALPTGCNVEGGELSLTLPNGSVLPLAGFDGTPAVPQVTWITPLVIEVPNGYTVTSDVAGDCIAAHVDYGPTAAYPDQAPGAFGSAGAATDASATATTTLSVLEAAPCPADRTADGVIDAGDLVQVTLHWGTSHAAGDANGDGFVDVHDLIAVILAWGAC